MNIRYLLALFALTLVGCAEPTPEVDVDALAAVPTCDRRTSETDRAYHECRYERALERLAIVDDPRFQPDYLGDVAVAALDAGRTSEARARAAEVREALAMLDAQVVSRSTRATEKAAIVEGRLALMAGDTATARTRLLDAGRVLAAPVQVSFGPNVTLARDLLAAGDTASVLAYFDVLDRTWEYGAGKVDAWRAALGQGEEPDFGPNLVY